MTRTIHALALTALAVTLATGTTFAGPPDQKPVPPPKGPPPMNQHHNFNPQFGPKPVMFNQTNNGHFAPPIVANYHLTYGTKFAYGYFYNGFNHVHWSNVYVHPFYGHRVYFDPFTRSKAAPVR